MLELFYEALSPANIIATSLLVFILFYWLTVMIGVLDAEFLDMDVDMDMDMDIDVDADMDVDADTDMDSSVGTGGGGWLIGLLQFFNIGAVPFTIYLSVLILSHWTISILFNYYMGMSNIWEGLLFFLPLLLGSLLVTKVFTMPLAGFFKKVKSSIAKDINLLGHVGTLTLSTFGQKMGQAEFVVDDNFLTINVKSNKGLALSKGTQIVIVDYLREENYYLVEAHK